MPTWPHSPASRHQARGQRPSGSLQVPPLPGPPRRQDGLLAKCSDARCQSSSPAPPGQLLASAGLSIFTCKRGLIHEPRPRG